MENNVKAWLIADTHFGMKSDDEDWLNEYIGYFENEIIPKMLSKVGENDILIHCGDVFENRTFIGLNTITKVIKLFEKLSSVFKEIKIVVGNHDIYKKSTNEITSLMMLKHIPHIKIYDDFCVETICGKVCLFNPWDEDTEHQKQILKEFNERYKIDYVFGHLQIGGSKTYDRQGNCVVMNGGVSPSDFNKAQVYAGHIHIRQDKKNIHYVGNPYHKDKGDIDNVKGITILDIPSGKIEFIENTYSPKFMKENIYDILNLTIDDLKKRWKNNRVELHINGCDMPKCIFDELRSCLNTYYKSLDTMSDNTIVSLDTSGDTVINEAKCSDEYCQDFIDKQDLEEKFKDRVINKLQEIKTRTV